MSVPELSVQIKNVPGQLVQITAVLAEAGVNVRGITASSAGKTGWVHVAVDHPKVAAEALDECGFSTDTGEALAVLVNDEPGSLDHALRVLADNKVNLDYIYSCVGRVGPKVMIVFGVQAPGKVEKILHKYGIETADIMS